MRPLRRSNLPPRPAQDMSRTAKESLRGTWHVSRAGEDGIPMQIMTCVYEINAIKKID